ncbi:hypothetical protein ROZALSC1DRAFT_25621 [Rozella allomycis CSF55]|uniref:Uncharacterized protein n=1 Tax=Rozella allomycis (strain CSF55) TaxID=988480 RepID=A0A4P9YD76_ROZAC|nr:hypothetical protein ROZALSC1DRAFT_25621 [Rozella allomycis CSF55]
MNFMTQLFISILISITTEFPFPNPPPLDNVGRLKENGHVVSEIIQARPKLHYKQVQLDPAVETTHQISDQIKAQKDVKSNTIVDQNDSIASQTDKELPIDSAYTIGKISHPQPLTDIYSADNIIENTKPSEASNKDDITIDPIIDDALKKNKDDSNDKINDNQKLVESQARDGETTSSDNTIATTEKEKDKDADKKKKGFMEDHIDRILTSIIASVTSTYITVSTFNKPYRPTEVKKED